MLPYSLQNRGLAFKCSSQRIGEWKLLRSDSGAFQQEPHSKGTYAKGKRVAYNGDRLQVHYLSIESKNEFIAEISDLIEQHVLGERKSAKYYAIILDFTPDSSHVVQTTFLMLYLVHYDSRIEIVERLLKFVDNRCKTGSDIAQMITETIEGHAIPLADYR